jgi:hypothetical protein
VILFPIYAASIWIAIGALRRSWMGLAIAACSAFPVLVLSHICIQYLPLPPGEPRPEWLYLISGAYAIVVAGVGLAIALSGRGRLASDCHHCGYDLRGVTTILCPECGTSKRCHACHASLALAVRGRCVRCKLPAPAPTPTPPDTAPARTAPSPRARRAAFRRALAGITTPRS